MPKPHLNIILSSLLLGISNLVSAQDILEFPQDAHLLMDMGDMNAHRARHSREVLSDLQLHLFNSPPASYSLEAYQTPIKNQQDRRTCWIFAAIAAIEAKYKRDYGLTLDLSEQYFNHVAKSTGIDYPKHYLYENQSSYWGGGSSYVVAEAKTYMIPLSIYAPYKNQTEMDRIKASIPEAGALDWQSDAASNHVTQEQVDAFEYSTQYIPMVARQNAKYGVKDYSLYDTRVARDPGRLEELISTNHEVVIDVDLKWKYNSTSGIFEYDTASAGGGHCFLLVGYDRSRQYFLVKNSWGDSALLKVSYEFFRNAAGSASTVNSVVPPSEAPQAQAKWLGFWFQDHDGWKGKLVVRRITDPNNDATRIGAYYGQDLKPHSVNGTFVDGGHGIRYFVANETENAPGSLTGQHFEVDQYSWDSSFAAGTTWWTPNGEGGVVLGRLPTNAPYSNSFVPSKWVGIWDMEHDGWKGILRINRVIPTQNDSRLELTYTDGNGQLRSAEGTLEKSRPTIAHFSIQFPGNSQNFVLHFHGWDDKLASGYTYWAGIRFGAHAVRR